MNILSRAISNFGPFVMIEVKLHAVESYIALSCLVGLLVLSALLASLTILILGGIIAVDIHCDFKNAWLN